MGKKKRQRTRDERNEFKCNSTVHTYNNVINGKEKGGFARS